MSANAATVETATVKGWCPGALRPMQTGDGLIVRVRPRCGELSIPQVLALCEIAGRCGNGHIDLTRRANLQIRGLEARDLPDVWAALSDAGLIDSHASGEAVRNVMVSPLSGIDPTEIWDVRPIVRALEAALSETPALWSLPGKFGFVVDGGGVLPLDGEATDIRLRAIDARGGPKIALGIDTSEGTKWFAIADPVTAHTAAVRLAIAFVAAPKPSPRSRMRDLDPDAIAVLRAAVSGEGIAAADVRPKMEKTADRVGIITSRGKRAAVGFGAPFGRLTADALTGMAEKSAELGIAALRLSPWRVLYAPVSGEPEVTTLLSAARDRGLATVPTDPLMAIDACPGAPACRSAWGDTHEAARRIAAQMPLAGVTSVHVSGCAKGCARSRAADLVLVASPDGFGIVRHGTAAAPASAVVNLNDLPPLSAPGSDTMQQERSYLRDGPEIYRNSFSIIRAEADLSRFSGHAEKVAVRIIHASGMVEIASDIIMSDDLASAGRGALLAGAPILCDANMVAYGVTRSRLPANNAVICTLDDPAVPDLAGQMGTTRSAAALELWRPRLAGAVVAIGNAPTALFRLLEMLDEGAPPPAAIIGIPVGFVGAAESKEALRASRHCPYLIVTGRKGGSAMAAAAVNALASETE